MNYSLNMFYAVKCFVSLVVCFFKLNISKQILYLFVLFSLLSKMNGNGPT